MIFKSTSFLIIVLGIFFMQGSALAAGPYEIYFEEGNKFFEQGEYKKAIGAYERALDVNSNFAPLYNQLGLSYERLNSSHEKMEWYYGIAIDIDPAYADAYENLGRVYKDALKLEKAEHYYRKALELNPNNVKVRFELAWIFLKNSKPNEAVAYFKEVLKYTQTPYAYYGLGLAYSLSRDNPSVLETITTLRSIGQDDLAAQLEEMIRTPYDPRKETATALVEEPIPSVQQPQQPATLNSPGSGSMRVRLRGTLYSVDPTVTPRPSKPAQEKQRKSLENSPPQHRSYY